MFSGSSWVSVVSKSAWCSICVSEIKTYVRENIVLFCLFNWWLRNNNTIERKKYIKCTYLYKKNTYLYSLA